MLPRLVFLYGLFFTTTLQDSTRSNAERSPPRSKRSNYLKTTLHQEMYPLAGHQHYGYDDVPFFNTYYYIPQYQPTNRLAVTLPLYRSYEDWGAPSWYLEPRNVLNEKFSRPPPDTQIIFTNLNGDSDSTKNDNLRLSSLHCPEKGEVHHAKSEDLKTYSKIDSGTITGTIEAAYEACSKDIPDSKLGKKPLATFKKFLDPEHDPKIDSTENDNKEEKLAFSSRNHSKGHEDNEDLNHGNEAMNWRKLLPSGATIDFSDVHVKPTNDHSEVINDNIDVEPSDINEETNDGYLASQETDTTDIFIDSSEDNPGNAEYDTEHRESQPENEALT